MTDTNPNGKAAMPPQKRNGATLIFENGSKIASQRGNRYKQNIRRAGNVRVGLWGVAGSGKSYSALKIARGLAGRNGRIFAIDTEYRLYQLADLFPEVDVFEMRDASPESWIEAVNEAEEDGCDVLVLDTFTDAWSGNGGLLEFKSKVMSDKPNVDTFQVWDYVNPKQNRLLDTITRHSQMHVVCTFQAKTEYDREKIPNSNKTKPVPIGLGPSWRPGVIEYRFDFFGMMNLEENGTHLLTWNKETRFLFQGKPCINPDEAVGETLKAWAEQGVVEPFEFEALHRVMLTERYKKNEWSADQTGQLLAQFCLEKFDQIATREQFLAVRQCLSLKPEKGLNQSQWLISKQPELKSDAEQFEDIGAF